MCDFYMVCVLEKAAHAANGELAMHEQPVSKDVPAPRSNDLVYFLASLAIFIILALLASDGSTLMR
jgi:hypothetical protein